MHLLPGVRAFAGHVTGTAAVVAGHVSAAPAAKLKPRDSTSALLPPCSVARGTAVRAFREPRRQTLHSRQRSYASRVIAKRPARITGIAGDPEGRAYRA